MSGRKLDPPRPLTDEEAVILGRIHRSRTEPVGRVARAAILLGVAGGLDYQQAAISVGQRSGSPSPTRTQGIPASGRLAAIDFGQEFVLSDQPSRSSRVSGRR